jgi:predicted small secreted protein
MVLGQGQMLKDKQRIRLFDAAVLIGVSDLPGEHMLKEGEVFIQVEPESFKIGDEDAKVFKKGIAKSMKLAEGHQE